MTTIILNKVQPNLITKLETLAKQNKRTLEEEITVILETFTEDNKLLTQIEKTQENDPLLSVIGIFDSKPIKSEDIDKELY